MEKKTPQWKKRIQVIEAVYSDLILAISYQALSKRIDGYEQWNFDQKKIFEFYQKNKSILIKDLEKFIKIGWSFHRMNFVLQSILLAAISEYCVIKTPIAVLIQQSILTSQKYADVDEHKMVNAILDKYFKTFFPS